MEVGAKAMKETKDLRFPLPRKIHRLLKAEAAKEERPVREIVTALIIRWLKEKGIKVE